MKNNSGIVARHDKVLIMLDEVDEKIEGTSLLKTEKMKEDERYGQVYGTIVSIGKNAFHRWDDDTPQAGDRVMIGKYTGRIIKRAPQDGKEYRLVEDIDIWSTLEDKAND